MGGLDVKINKYIYILIYYISITLVNKESLSPSLSFSLLTGVGVSPLEASCSRTTVVYRSFLLFPLRKLFLCDRYPPQLSSAICPEGLNFCVDGVRCSSFMLAVLELPASVRMLFTATLGLSLT